MLRTHMLLFSFAWAADVCQSWSTDAITTELGDLSVESSGIVESPIEAGLFYSLDDAGNDAVLHLFTLEGSVEGNQTIEGAENVDWEDLGSGPCVGGVEGEACLYIADIGDNNKERDSVTLYLVPASRGLSATATACTMRYEDGQPQDAEALLVSPDGTVRIVTKEAGGDAKIYRLDAPPCEGKGLLVEEAELNLSGDSEEDRKVTAGAMSADGTMVVLRSYSQAWLWRGCTLDWGAEPEMLDLGSQPLGEAIAFAADGALVTSSEGNPFRVWELPCLETADLTCPSCGCGEGSSWLLLGVLGVWRRRRS